MLYFINKNRILVQFVYVLLLDINNGSHFTEVGECGFRLGRGLFSIHFCEIFMIVAKLYCLLFGLKNILFFARKIMTYENYISL